MSAKADGVLDLEETIKELAARPRPRVNVHQDNVTASESEHNM